jgi:hypothetical protein
MRGEEEESRFSDFISREDGGHCNLGLQEKS